MKKIGMIVAGAAVAVLVGGSAWAHDGDSRRGHNHDRDRDVHRNHNSHNNHNNHGRRGVSREAVMMQYARAFIRLDRNNDNRIGPREMRRANGHHGGRRNHHDGRRDGHDGRRDNYNHNDYRGGSRGRNSIINQRTFNRFDVNRNGFLTRRELRQGVRRAFNRSDRNNNGRLGPRELREARWYNGGNLAPRRRH